MKTFTIHEPPAPSPDGIEHADQLEFVKDGFSWATAVFPPLGFAINGLWLPIAGYVAALLVLEGLGQLVGTSDDVMGLLVFALHVFLGFELHTLKSWWLDRKGWRILGAATGKTLEDCERRFFEDWTPDQPATAAPALARPPKVGLPRTVGWP